MIPLRRLERTIRGDINKLRKKATQAVQRTARKAVRVVKKNTPVAFGELKNSVEAGEMVTRVTAPHASAVEAGSRPHLVPLEALIKWVKLRGSEGLTKKAVWRTTRRKTGWSGPTSREHAIRVAGQLRDLETNGSLSINAPEQIARAIQQAILKNGTRPHWFVQNSLPEVMTILDEELKKVFK